MDNVDGFYTMKGYSLINDKEMTCAMEDYLEMIIRLSKQSKVVRVCDLSKMLHVRPSSATKMVQQLDKCGFIKAEKYENIYLTDKGNKAGEYLLYRHDVIQKFLCALNQSESELEQVEKIEHFLDYRTVKNLDELTKNMR